MDLPVPQNILSVDGHFIHRTVLVVAEVYAGEYGAGRVRSRRTRGQERLVGRSAAGVAVGVAETQKLRSSTVS